MKIAAVRDHELLALVHSAVSGSLSMSDFEERMVADWWNEDSALARAVWGILSETSGHDADRVVVAELRRLLPSQNDTTFL